MRSEEQNPGRVPTLYRDEPKGSLDFVRSGAYLSPGTDEAKSLSNLHCNFFTTSSADGSASREGGIISKNQFSMPTVRHQTK